MPSPMNDARVSETLDEMIARRVGFLTDYQNAAYAQKFKALVDKVRAAEQQKTPGSTSLSEAVARYAFKLMAYKDEYEVARSVHERRFRKARPRSLRRRFQDPFPSCAAAVRSARQRRKSSQVRIWIVGVRRVQVSGEAQGFARRRIRCFRLYDRTQTGAPADRRLQRHASTN